MASRPCTGSTTRAALASRSWRRFCSSATGCRASATTSGTTSRTGSGTSPPGSRTQDGSLEPQAVLSRVLAEETWGKVYSSALDFGTPGNNIFLGNVYTGAAGSTVALMATSYMEDASITLTVTGTGSVTVVDGWGNANVTALSQGRVTVPMTEVPMYVELPVGAQAGVYQSTTGSAGDRGKLLLRRHDQGDRWRLVPGDRE